MHNLRMLIFVLVLASLESSEAVDKSNLHCIHLLAFEAEVQSALTTEEFYSLIATTVNLETFAIKTYGSEFGLKALKLLKDLNPSFLALLADVPTMSRLNHFVQYVRLSKLQNEPLATVKKRYRESLGIRRVYRALSLTTKQFLFLKDRALQSHALRLFPDDFKSNLAETLDIGLLEILRDRFEYPRVKVFDDIFLSFSEFAEISAAAVAATILTEHRDVYIFQLDVPVAEFIEMGSPPFTLPPRLEAKVAEGLQAVIVRPDNTSHTYMFNSSVERFTVLQVPAQYVSGVYRVNEGGLPKYESKFGDSINPDSNQSYLQEYTTKLD